MADLPSIPDAAGTRRVWLHVGTLLDGSSTAPRHRAHVVYDEHGISYVGNDDAMPPAELLNPGQTSPDVVAPDATLLPGLIEAHAHLFLEGGELDFGKRAAYLEQNSDDLLAAARRRLPKLVELGVTAVRDAGDKDGVGLALSRQSKSEDRPVMPYLDSPGAALHHAGRYGKFMGSAIEEHASVEDCVASRVAEGADRIKLLPTGIINFQKGLVTAKPQMDTAEVAAIVAAAKAHGRQTFAHASGDIGIDHAIDGGVDSIEHGFFLRDDQLAKLRDLQIGWVPTFAPVQLQVDHADLFGWDTTVVGNLQRILDNHAAALCKAHEMGVLIIAGSDAGSCGVAHGFGFFYELELMERAGLPSLAVVNSATGVSAGRLGFEEKFGRIEAGYRSRFMLTNHPPLEGVGNFRRPKSVVFDGRVFAQAEPFDATGL